MTYPSAYASIDYVEQYPPDDEDDEDVYIPRGPADARTAAAKKACQGCVNAGERSVST
jgi:hypothetical protein